MSVDCTDGRSLRAAVLASAAARPEDVALVVGDRALSYAELVHRASADAAALRERLGRRPERVAILGHRSVTSLVAPLSAMFAGAAFVPLQPNAPAARTRRILELAEPDALLADEASLPKAAALIEGLERPPLVLSRELGGAASPSAPPPLLPDDVACLLFTSGSTGVPKGVPVTHANVLAFLDVARERWRLGPGDRVAQVSDQTFDLSLFDLFAAWDTGAATCSLSSSELLAPARALQRLGCTAWFSVPSVIAHLRSRGLLRPGLFPTLRLSLFAGEPLPLQSALAWQEAAPNGALECLYGPTETTIVNFGHRFDPQATPPACEGGIVPIGRPFPGTGCVVVDESLQPVTEGGAGELLACGAQVTPGYWRSSGEAEPRHLRRSFDGGPPRLWFRTGDRVRRLPSGDYAFLGRVDHQVKISGYRFELGEIESVLRRQAGVLDALAIAWPRTEGGAALGIVAAVVPAGIDGEALREACAAELPARAVPSRILAMAELPRNANGKADRHQVETMMSSGVPR